MKYLILLATLALVKGQTDSTPVGAVTCKDNHTVTVVITNVEDIGQWTTTEWRLQSNPNCDPTFSGTTVTYTNLVLPDCAKDSLQEDNNVTIKYIIEISIKKPDPGAGADQLRAYDHLYYVSCEYDNNGTAMANFTPVVNKADNDSAFGLFTFELDVFTDAEFTTNPTNPVRLNQDLHVRALVVTQSDTPNLDLHLVSCWASSSSDKNSLDNKVVFIEEGCGDDDTSDDFQDLLAYNCTTDNKQESFEIPSFRYYDFAEGSPVYFHCDLRVCLADNPSSACECPADPDACASSRKRRSVGEYVKEIHVKSGPYYFADDKEDEGDLKEQEKPQSFSTNLTIIVAVSGVVVVAVIVCVTIYLVVRSRNRRVQSNDLNVAT